MNLTFSVIIPTLNEEKSLPLLLDCLVKQTSKDFEVIISDGGSSDATKEVARSYSAQLPLRFLPGTKLKKSPAVQRNSGAANARGRYLVFLDADSKIESHILKVLKQEIAFNHADIYVPQVSLEDNRLLYRLTESVVNAISLFGLKVGFIQTPGGGFMIVKKATFHELGGFDEKVYIYEDQELVWRAAKAHKSIQASNARFFFNLRRVYREGFVRVMLKYIWIVCHYMLVGNVYKPLYKYEMGGGAPSSPRK